MKFHKEGKQSILLAFTLFMSVVGLSFAFLEAFPIVQGILIGIFFLLLIIILQFFRNPVRTIIPNENVVYAPADGKVVVIEEVVESEYFKDKRRQVSIFMSPFNVHVNRNPFSGLVTYFKYHPGKYLVAWHPKSSTENERTTVVIQNQNGTEVLLRQIAGALAKRICWYVDKGSQEKQGEDFGFIKFGSRVDIFLPLDAEINVSLGQKSFGNKTVIATLK